MTQPLLPPVQWPADELLIYSDAPGIIRSKNSMRLRPTGSWKAELWPVTVDADPPSSSLAETLPAAINYYAIQDVQLGVYTSDAGSEVSLLELGVNFQWGHAILVRSATMPGRGAGGFYRAGLVSLVPAQPVGRGRSL
ncbi:MAG: hypothetical protein R2867_26665 [Caldilineaceae bacterium]